MRTGKDYTTIKYTTSIQREWIGNYNSIGNLIDIAKAIALDSAGNVYVTGTIDKTQPNNSGKHYQAIVTIKYNALGDLIWAIEYGSGTENYDVHKIATDVKGNIYILGESQLAKHPEKYIIIKSKNIKN